MNSTLLRTQATSDNAVFDTVRPYEHAACQGLLAHIASLIPSAISVRTDRTSAGSISDTNGQRIFIELPAEKYRVGLRPDPKELPAVHLAKKFNLDRDDAQELQCSLTTLASMSSLAAWPMKTSTVPPLIVSKTHCMDQPLASGSYLSETCEILAEDLPGVASIEMDYVITGNPRAKVGSRRRAFIRFIGKQPGTELLSIDSAGMPLHARKQILKTIDTENDNEQMFLLNLYRMESWAKALGTDADTLAETFPTLNFFASSLHVTKIELA